MEWVYIKEKQPELNQQVLASDGKNFHIAVYSQYDGLEHYNCDYSCRVKDSVYWQPVCEPDKCSHKNHTKDPRTDGLSVCNTFMQNLSSCPKCIIFCAHCGIRHTTKNIDDIKRYLIEQVE